MKKKSHVHLVTILIHDFAAEREKDLQWKYQTTKEAQEEAEKLEEIRARREQGAALREERLEGKFVEREENAYFLSGTLKLCCLQSKRRRRKQLKKEQLHY